MKRRERFALGHAPPTRAERECEWRVIGQPEFNVQQAPPSAYVTAYPRDGALSVLRSAVP